MALYSYIDKKTRLKKKIAKFFSFIFIFSGIGIMIWVAYPIVSFELTYAHKFNKLLTPLPQDFESSIKEFPNMLGLTSDYTKASIWFPKALKNLKSFSFSQDSYTLTIPKLGIYHANVLVGGEDLSKSLIHFTGPLPGNLGNSVIFGHSTLLWFYNPTDYKSIFSKLPELDIDDEINVNLDNISYTYKVFEMKIISPDNLSVLSQDYSDSYITLITCVPPGTYFKRLAVKGRLIKI